MLYLVPTPIGNLEDISLRALRLLREADVILAEDTRVSRTLLQHYQITTSLRPYHAHNEHRVVEQLISELSAGATIALISDAGTPGISDAGFLLVRACHAAGITVTCLPGATAIIPALVQSGLPCDRFHFEGFLPHKKGRMTRLKWLAVYPFSAVLFESPTRLIRLLGELAAHCGSDRQVSVTREISKLHEETRTGSLEEVIAYFSAKDKVRGEIVVVLGGTTD
ncbi:MAG: 16S rRNA (cytidine(1402)-2'-O)-methyltransferase [Saprospiraceae bacterium]|jgi:16S rRNA (cytidine1402-2'-O)-methyltransferase|nr:16S rRNA (cytidine(1402)-2'-O)-methyltransferase [Saprospiraceae bacterium]